MSAPRPKLLFLAYPFPPSPAIGGVRAWGMAKYLSRLGWQVTVVTPDPSGRVSPAEMEEAERQCRQEGITRLFAGELEVRSGEAAQRLTVGRWERCRRLFVRRVFRCMGMGLEERWWRTCLVACSRLAPGDCDVVLATGSPFSVFLAARRIARRLKVPFVLDYRDPWSLAIHGAAWNKLWRRPVERRVLREAAATLIVSPSLARSQTEAFQLSRPPVVIPNGYDPEWSKAVIPAVFTDFSVVYAGNFYVRQREIDSVVRAIKRASEISRGKIPMPIRLHYYGRDIPHVEAAVQRHGAEGLVECHGRVPRTEVLAAIKGAGCAVVIASIRERVGLTERGIVTGKLFEPLGLGVPILLVAPEDSDAAKIVEGSGAGRSFRASQAEAMAHWLVECADGKSGRRYEPPAAFSWPVLAQTAEGILAALMRQDRAGLPNPGCEMNSHDE